MYSDESLKLAHEEYLLTNETLRLMGTRASTRQFVQNAAGETSALSDAEKDAIIQSALRAPTAGNLLAYSIINIVDQEVKDKLALLCDNQAFIAQAPFALVFVADYQKWIDAFEATSCGRFNEKRNEATTQEGGNEASDASQAIVPGEGSFMLAVNDALIAAQNAVIAAESLGIGSCYIGDVMEQGPQIAELLKLPQHTFPAAFVVFGRPRKPLKPTEHFCTGAVMTDAYERPTREELAARIQDMTLWAPPSRMSKECQTYPESVYVRKFNSSFMKEMDSSVRWWLDRFLSVEEHA